MIYGSYPIIHVMIFFVQTYITQSLFLENMSFEFYANDLTARDSEKGAVGCDEASLRIVNDVCQEWKEIVEEYCMTRGVIKEKGSLKASVLFLFQKNTRFLLNDND